MWIVLCILCPPLIPLIPFVIIHQMMLNRQTAKRTAVATEDMARMMWQKQERERISRLSPEEQLRYSKGRAMGGGVAMIIGLLLIYLVITMIGP